MNLQPILNKNSSWVHIKLEFELLSVARKVVKYVVLAPHKINKTKIIFHYILGCYLNNRLHVLDLKEFGELSTNTKAHPSC
jgi:hypothetical protein